VDTRASIGQLADEMHRLAGDAGVILAVHGPADPRAWTQAMLRTLAGSLRNDLYPDEAFLVERYAASRVAVAAALQHRDRERKRARRGVPPGPNPTRVGRAGRTSLPPTEPWHADTPPWLERPGMQHE
jgi:hypothetical protein